MDNTDPNNPNIPAGTPTPPPAPSPWETPASPVQTPDLGMSAPATPPPAPAASPDMSWATPPAMPDPAMNAAPPPTPPMENPTNFAPATPPNPMASNPFLQPQAPTPPPPTDPNMFSQPAPTAAPADLGQIAPAPSLPQTPVEAPPPPPASPFPTVPPQPVQDPLNTAFAPAPNTNEVNLFGNPSAPSEPNPPAPQIPAQPIQPDLNPAPSLNPTPIPDFMNPQATTPPAPPQNTIADMAQGTTSGAPAPEMPTPTLTPPAENPPIPQAGQPGTLDLSSLQANSTSPAAPEISGASPNQPGNMLPEVGPVENAPTDLSHLIAGEETSGQPSNVYNPPVASDQNPTLNTSQPQTPSEDGAPAEEKHLNLTKVLLVAGIPIILIVAALSAYLILGVGKSSPNSTQNQTSLPVVESEPSQAPLTNPPDQIVAPSPSPATVLAPLASPSGPESTASATTTLPKGSSSPTSALEQLKARQASPSPAPSSASL